MSIKVNEIVTVEVKASDGQVLKRGDCISIRVKTEDIVCRYRGIENGYFVTETLCGDHENKYRQGSIEACHKITGLTRINPDAGIDKTENQITEQEDIENGTE